MALSAAGWGAGPPELCQSVLPREPLNPLASLSDTQLWNSHLLLELGCGRNKSSLTKRRRQYYCLLAENLKIEAVTVPVATRLSQSSDPFQRESH